MVLKKRKIILFYENYPKSAICIGVVFENNHK